MNIHHIGYAVSDLDKAILEFKSMGYELKGNRVVDEKRNVVIQFVETDGYLVELVTPLSENSPVSEALRKRGSGPYHICHEAQDIDTEIERMILNGYKLIESPKVAPACGNKRVVFLFKVSIGILELIEKESL